MNRRAVAWLAALAGVLHAPSFVRPFMDMDEGSYAGLACRMLDGGRIYHDAVENKFPGVFYIYKGTFAVFGRYNMLAIHVLVTLVALATALVVAAIAKRYAGERAARWAAPLYLVFSASYYPKMLAANTEMFAVLPGAVAVWCYLNGRDKARWLVAAGAAGALTFMCKQVALATFAALLADRALTGLREPLRALRDLALLAVGFAIVVGAMAWHLAAIGVWDDAKFWTWTYVLHFYLPSGNADHGIAFNVATCLLPFLLVASPLVYLAVRGRDRTLSALYWWLAGNFCAGLVGGRMYGHYFLLMVPALATLAGIGAARYLDDRRRERAMLVGAVSVMAAAFLVAACVFEPVTEKLFRADPDYREAARYVRERTADSDQIFVWGWYPPLYEAAGRCPSTRFVYTHILSGAGGEQARGHSVPGAWDMLLDDLQAAPPAYILDTSTGDYRYEEFAPEKFPRLWDWMAPRYEVETTVSGVRIYRRRGA